MTLLGLAIFSIVGVFCRYGIDRFFPVSSPQAFPWHTFTINTVGSFLIGIIFVLASEKGILSDPWRLVLTTGFIGSFTTFSAFSIQNYLLIQEGRVGLAATYSVVSVLAGIFSVYIGVIASRMIVTG